MVRLFNALGAPLLSFFQYLGEVVLLAADTFRSIFTHKLRWKLFLNQVVEVGLLSQLVVVITGAFTGAVFSAQTFFLYPRALSENLRYWLETYPDRILFGTDAFSFTAAVDWGEVAWLSNTTARQALALALTGMMNDGDISRARAIELARMVLRDNAVKLYRLQQ